MSPLPDKAPLALVESVDDPELPHVTIGDLGMVRSVELGADGRVSVTLTPTFTGCPATQQIADDVEEVLRGAGYEPDVRFAYAPAWTTDWITEAGRAKLAAAGIAPPPSGVSAGDLGVLLDMPVACPRCGSRQTRRQSEFGATACKAPYVCNACKEPFEWFKPL
ncbi:MAG: 1,2-phenylacetyl-CoA epoxidase subunit PaaD [Acidimicrobiales bacterium]|nr:phenylacetate-CoA oxygenase subunit PaaJ [Acidimicrobiales bacterium]